MVTVALVTAILLIPTPLRVQGTLVLTAAKPVEVYAEVPGRLDNLYVRDGEMVKQGQILASLSNPEKRLEQLQLKQEQETNHVKGVLYRSMPDALSRATSMQHFKMENDLEPALEKIDDQIGKLTLIADRDGQVMGVPQMETRGQYLKPGKPFFELGDPQQLEAHLILDQSDVDLILQSDAKKRRPPGSRSTGLPRRPGRATSPRSPSATATRSPPSCPTTPAARSPPSPTPRPAPSSR